MAVNTTNRASSSAALDETLPFVYPNTYNFDLQNHPIIPIFYKMGYTMETKEYPGYGSPQSRDGDNQVQNSQTATPTVCDQLSFIYTATDHSSGSKLSSRVWAVSLYGHSHSHRSQPIELSAGSNHTAHSKSRRRSRWRYTRRRND